MTATMERTATEFDCVWEKVAPIEGWLTRQEAELLWESAKSLLEYETIVEIGSYQGKSATLFAESGRGVVMFDIRTTEGVVSVCRRYPRMFFQQQASTDVDWQAGPIHLLYIDGDHIAPAPRKDFEHFERHLAENALVAWHDYGQEPGVTLAVNQLEAEGRIVRVAQAGSLWVGRVTHGLPKPKDTTRVYLIQPAYGGIRPASYHAVQRSHVKGDGLDVTVIRAPSSLLAHHANEQLVQCFNDGEFELFGIVHADIAPDENFIATMWGEMQAHNLDVLHACAAIKNYSGLTSTAADYAGERWHPVRRITTAELAQLPETFTVDTLREFYGPEVKRLLPNTGCILMRLDLLYERRFSGFAILDRIRWTEPTEPGRKAKGHAECVPEDWNFGHWCAENGLRVGGTKKVITRHYGEAHYSTDLVWGKPRDEKFFESMATLEVSSNGHG